jgi:hypothetical protein
MRKKNYYYYKYVSFIFPRTDLSHIAWVTCFTATGEANGESSAVKNLTIGEVRASLDGQLELSFPDPQVIESSTSGSEAIED